MDRVGTMQPSLWNYITLGKIVEFVSPRILSRIVLQCPLTSYLLDILVCVSKRNRRRRVRKHFVEQTQPLGWHWLVDMYECRKLPDTPEVLQTILIEAARLAKATVVQTCFHRYSPHGLSGVVVIAESHLAAHTWPEYQSVCVDLFSCSQRIEANIAIDFIAKQVDARRCERRCETRGQHRSG